MSCEQTRDRLTGYLEGSLDPALAAATKAHLDGCESCRADEETARWIGSHTAGLRREIAPPNDLWVGIAPRLHRRSRRLDWPMWSVAAAAVLLVAATSAVTFVMTRDREQSVLATDFASTEAGYAQAALELSDWYAKGRDSLAPETRAVVERSMAVIERALDEARAALRADPFNRTLEAMVVAAYRRKIEFLERAAALERES